MSGSFLPQKHNIWSISFAKDISASFPSQKIINQDNRYNYFASSFFNMRNTSWTEDPHKKTFFAIIKVCSRIIWK
jgi:hypothetical protein